MTRRRIFQIGVFLTAGLLIWLIFLLADTLRDHDATKAFIESYGLFGMFIMGLISGFNVLIPIPAAAFTPVFLEVGFTWITIVLVLTAGTVLADSLGFALGRAGKAWAETNPPQVVTRLTEFVTTYPKWIVPIVFLYAAFSPLPNEVLLIPLGLIGFRFVLLFIPLLFGNMLNQAWLTLGFNGIFELFF